MATTLDKLEIIQDACLQAGLEPPQVEDDGSPEWDVGSRAWERNLGLLIEEHPWNFLTKTATLVAVSPSPSPEEWEFAWAKPGDMVHMTGLIANSTRWRDFAIRGNRIMTTVTGTVIAEYVAARDDETTWRYGFIEALTLRVEAALLRAIPQDQAEANNRDKKAERALMNARVRNDQEQPPRRGFVSSLLARRQYGVRGRSR